VPFRVLKQTCLRSSFPTLVSFQYEYLSLHVAFHTSPAALSSIGSSSLNPDRSWVVVSPVYEGSAFPLLAVFAISFFNYFLL